MLSGIGPRQHLEKYNIKVLLDLPVGENYQDHSNLRILDSMPIPITIENLEELYFNRSGLLSEYPVLMTYISTQNIDKNWPNINFDFDANPFTSKIGVLIELQRVKSRGSVCLQSVSPYIPPMIAPNFLSDPRDFEAMVDAIKLLFYVFRVPEIRHFFPQNNLERVGCPPCPGVEDYLCDTGIRCFVRRSTTASWHSSGTCRMGAVERDDVVVDPRLRVKKIRNLRVCDTSIFPEIPNANTNAAANMVGEKCADLIKQDHFI